MHKICIILVKQNKTGHSIPGVRSWSQTVGKNISNFDSSTLAECFKVWVASSCSVDVKCFKNDDDDGDEDENNNVETS